MTSSLSQPVPPAPSLLQADLHADAPFSGVPWALAGCALTSTSFLFAKLLGQTSHYSALEINLYRSIIMLVCLGGYALPRGYSVRTGFLPQQWSRATTGWCAAVLQTFALNSVVPMPTIQMLSYTNPIFLVLILAFWYKQSIALPVWGGVALGFIGAGILLHPDSLATQSGDALVPQAAALGSGFLTALSFLNIQRLARTGEPAWRVVFYFSLFSMGYSAIGLLVSGQPLKGIPTLQDAWWIAGLGFFILAGQLCTTRSYSQGNTSITAVFSYSHLLFATFFSLLVFHQSLDVLSCVGITVIVLGGLLTRMMKR